MKRRTHLFLVAVDEDQIPGAFDKDRIHMDVERVVKNNIISGYNPLVAPLAAVVRESNFLQEVEVELSIVIAAVNKAEDGDIDLDKTEIIYSSPLTLFYPPSNNEMLGEEE